LSRRRPPNQDVRVFNIQNRFDRSGVTKPFIVRWKVDGKEHSRGHHTRPEADGYRSRLLLAKRDGERFDRRTGEPESWAPASEDLQAHLWARKWVAENWPEWQPRTRTNELEGLARFIPLVVDARAPTAPPGLRGYLRDTLRPDAELDPDHECERWLGRWVLALGELDRKNLAEAQTELGKRDDGTTAAAETSKRYRRTAKSCVRRAVELEYIAADPWPPSQRGRSRRKVNRVNLAVDVKRLHAPATAVRVFAHMENHQPASRMYRMMTETVYYAALRPSEVKMLRPEAVHLPDEDKEDEWGAIDVDEADDGEDNPADPKTGRRRVPIPPRYVRRIRAWLKYNNIKPRQLIFRTRCGNAPSDTNWSRALQGAHRRAKVHHIAVYDYRHAAATTWIRNGMPLREAAARLGDSVETLVAYYIDAMEGDEERGNAAVEAAFDGVPETIDLKKEKPS